MAGAENRKTPIDGGEVFPYNLCKRLHFTHISARHRALREGTMTIYDISKKAGVSIATVSRVINGSEKVSEKTRKKVLAVMEESGYTPNLFARGLGLNTMNLIGILCVDSSDLFLAKAVYYLERMLHENGYGCLLCCTGYQQGDKEKYMKVLLSKKVDACILVGSSLVGETPQDSRYILEAAREVPVLLLNAFLDAPKLYCVLEDDFRATYQTTRRLYAAGVTDLLYYYDSNSYSGREKLRGFQTAMKELGIPLSRQKISYYSGSREDIAAICAQLEQLHQSGVSFQGVIASDDNLALSAVKYALSHGWKVPEEFAAVGYNNSLLAQCCQPQLTTIDNHLEAMCRHLAAILMDLQQGKPAASQTVFPCALVEGGTTPPLGMDVEETGKNPS